MNGFRLGAQTLPAQLALTFTAVVVFTALASWFPELWLSQEQLDEQAWQQVEQDERIRREQQILRTGLISISVIIVAGAALAVIVAKHVSKPLSELADAATRLSRGNLDAKIGVATQVREVVLVAQALEQARRNLQSTMADLQREKAWASQLLGSIVEGIVTLDQKGIVTFWSKGAERITGCRRHEVMGRHCNEVFQPLETRKRFMELIPGLQQRRKILVARPGGGQATLSLTLAQLAPTDVAGESLVLVFRDVSEEDAVQRLLGHFLANMTHEFRTPLAALGAAIELLMDQLPTLSQEQLEELLRSLHLGILSLQTLVDNLLESASLEAGRFSVSPRPADLHEIVVEAARIMEPLLVKYEQRLVLNLSPGDPTVHADPRRTVQVLINLLSNASKYGPADAEITLDVALRNDVACVMVGDRGMGVPAAQRDLLFHRFVHFGTQDDSSRYGSGLGLWVVKSIVEAQGGKVGVEERPGGGSTFWFTVPIAKEP